MAGFEDGGGRIDAGALAAAFAGLPAALQALQDRAVAEAVAQASGLVRDHYALYHRSAGGGGGWALLTEHTVSTSGGEHSVRLPASGSLAPGGYASLALVWQARSHEGTTGALSLQLRLNDDTASHYRMVDWTALSDGYTEYEGTTGSFATVTEFYAGRVAASGLAAGAAAAGRVELPQAGRSTFWQPLLAAGVAPYYATVDTHLMQSYGFWNQTAAVTSLSVRHMDVTFTRNFAVGSHFAVYGLFGGA